jgi:hypothetical protein
MGLYIKDINFNMKDKKNVISLVVFSILLTLSIFIQVVGVFYYPNGGDINSKLWDWGNPQIISTFCAGVPSHTSYFQQFQFILNYCFSI